MLRLPKILCAAVATAALFAAPGAFAQAGLADRLSAADKQLQADVQACKPINLGDYTALLQEAAKNKLRAAKAAKKGVPVDQAQVDADLAKASSLFHSAQAALVAQCLRQAQAAQQPKETSLNLSPFANEILVAHNKLRAEVGSPPLQWDPALAANATAHARLLASGVPYAHASRAGREKTERENLSKGLLGWTPEQMMKSWLAEKPNFVAGIFPDVSRTGDWSNVGHYSQMIWAMTVRVGCGQATSSQWSYLVCRYSPPGNQDGKPVLGPPIGAQQIATTSGKPIAAVALNTPIQNSGAVPAPNVPVANNEAPVLNFPAANVELPIVGLPIIFEFGFYDADGDGEYTTCDAVFLSDYDLPKPFPSTLDMMSPSEAFFNADGDAGYSVADTVYLDILGHIPGPTAATPSDPPGEKTLVAPIEAFMGEPLTPLTPDCDTKVEVPTLPKPEIFKPKPHGSIDPDNLGPIQFDLNVETLKEQKPDP